MNPLLKEYLWSSFITFATAFLFAIVPLLGDAEPTRAALFALALAGTRAGIKAIANLITTKGETISSK